MRMRSPSLRGGGGARRATSCVMKGRSRRARRWTPSALSVEGRRRPRRLLNRTRATVRCRRPPLLRIAIHLRQNAGAARAKTTEDALARAARAEAALADDGDAGPVRGRRGARGAGRGRRGRARAARRPRRGGAGRRARRPAAPRPTRPRPRRRWPTTRRASRSASPRSWTARATRAPMVWSRAR